VLVRAAPELLTGLAAHFGEAVRDQIAQAVPDDQGWVGLRLNFEYFEEARTRLLGYGRALEVLAPHPLRLSLIDYASQITAFYQERASQPGGVASI
jgi:predicted DNA-binding transcriptional regulator YafY